MRVLYDTNVLVATLSRRESILAFKELIQQGKIVHVSSAYILNEVEVVLAKKLKLTKQKARAAARLLERQSMIATPQKIKKVCRDPFDDYVLAAADEGSAKYLVTADKDLLVLKTHEGISIITPKAFQKLIQ
jgi:uncharacterized protein